MTPYDALCRYIQVVEEVVPSFENDCTLVVFALRQFMLFTQDIYYFVCGSPKASNKPSVDYSDFYSRLQVISIEVPGTVKIALNGLFNRYLGDNTTYELWDLSPSVAMSAYNVDIKRAKSILSWCSRSKWMHTYARYNSFKHNEYEIRAASNPYCMPISGKIEELEEQRTTPIRRSRLLYKLAATLEPHWNIGAREYCRQIHVYDGAIYAFASCYGVRAGHLYIGIDDAQLIRFSPSGVRLDTSLTFIPIVQVRNVRECIKDMGTMRSIILHHALLDSEDGSSLERYVDKVHEVLYLFVSFCKSALNPGDWNRVKLWFPVMFTLDFRKSLLHTEDAPAINTFLDIDALIASVGRPSFERYRGEGRKSACEFDYITVEITLLSKYASIATEVIKNSKDRVEKLVLDKIAATKRMQGKDLLLNLLYVKEVVVCNGGLSFTAWVEFKPGVEQTLADTSVSKMQLQ